MSTVPELELIVNHFLLLDQCASRGGYFQFLQQVVAESRLGRYPTQIRAAAQLHRAARMCLQLNFIRQIL